MEEETKDTVMLRSQLDRVVELISKRDRCSVEEIQKDLLKEMVRRTEECLRGNFPENLLEVVVLDALDGIPLDPLTKSTHDVFRNFPVCDSRGKFYELMNYLFSLSWNSLREWVDFMLRSLKDYIM